MISPLRKFYPTFLYEINAAVLLRDAAEPHTLSLPRFQRQWLESCFYTDPIIFTYELENNLDDNSKMFPTTLQLLSETTNWIEEYCKLNG